MEDKDKDKKSRWVSILVTAEIHKELTIIALDKDVSLGDLTKKIIADFVDCSTKKEVKK